jgi:hypothetical protein
LTAYKLSKNNYPNKLHIFKEYVTIIAFLAHPGQNVPYVIYSQFGRSWWLNSHLDLGNHTLLSNFGKKIGKKTEKTEISVGNFFPL